MNTDYKEFQEYYWRWTFHLLIIVNQWGSCTLGTYTNVIKCEVHGLTVSKVQTIVLYASNIGKRTYETLRKSHTFRPELPVLFRYSVYGFFFKVNKLWLFFQNEYWYMYIICFCNWLFWFFFLIQRLLQRCIFEFVFEMIPQEIFHFIENRVIPQVSMIRIYDSNLYQTNNMYIPFIFMSLFNKIIWRKTNFRKLRIRHGSIDKAKLIWKHFSLNI